MTARVAARFADDGPRCLPQERTSSGRRRFPGRYTSSTQIVLVASAAVSLAIQEGGAAVVLLGLAVLNAVIGPAEEAVVADVVLLVPARHRPTGAGQG
ncbi:hypothetical protein [Streptomyces sp. NPDC088360]|uniref:hypothetical protein n=1 Tax=Streptomyces sp. NPDC088360 TaxID=3154515 RepID=UPI00344B9130